MGETIDNFITRLQTLAEHCDYEGERDNQVRDHAISYIKDKNLKSTMYREEILTLGKLMEIVGHYRDKEALILLPESFPRVSQANRKTKSVGVATKLDIMRKIVFREITSVQSVVKSVIVNRVVIQRASGVEE